MDPVAGGSVTKYPGTAYAGPAYVNNSDNTLPNTGEGQSKASGITNDDDPGGRIKVNAYRAIGDYLALVARRGLAAGGAGRRLGRVCPRRPVRLPP